MAKKGYASDMERVKPPKRLRGWKLQQAKEAPCQKGLPQDDDGNPLSLRLVELWSQGKLSATQACQIAHLSLLSGCEHPDILAIARCGNFGSNAGSSHRDMINLYCKQLMLPEPHLVSVPVKDPKTQRAGCEDVALMLPHVIFSQLHAHYPDSFEEFFAVKECGSFWASVQKMKDPRLVKPIALTKGKVRSPSTTIPCFVHGDGCEFQTRDSLMTWSWGSLLCLNASLSSHLLLTAVPKSCTIAGTWDPLDQWIAWSFAALAKGTHPHMDPWGKPLTKGLMAQLAGQPLTKGHHRGVLWSIQSDLEFTSNILKLPHWKSKNPCHECDCEQPLYRGVECEEGKSVKILKKSEQEFIFTSPDDALLDKRSNHPLFSIEGVSSALVRQDSLRVLYSRGVASHLAGNLLFYLCLFDWPKRQKVAPSTRLARIFERIREIYVEQNVSARLTNLRPSMVWNPQKVHKQFPCLEAKASECKHFLPCLEIVFREALQGRESALHDTMLLCIKAFNELTSHFDSLGAFLTKEEFNHGQNLAKRFFDAYQDLNDWAASQNRKMFNITFKFHAAMHMFKNCEFLNYRAHQNFRAEDFVGKISQLGHSCSFGVKASRISCKLMDKYRILLHLQLTQQGFAFEDDEP